MTRHRIAQIGENRNPKSPENRSRTRRFLQNRLLQVRRLAALLKDFGASSRTTTTSALARSSAKDRRSSKNSTRGHTRFFKRR
jgi:hypothetical protein